MNKKPKNGITAFFTESSFHQWIEKDSHERRLAANLEKMCKGVILPRELFEKKEPVQQSAATSSGLVNKIDNDNNISDENTVDYQLDGTEVKSDSEPLNERGLAATVTEAENNNAAKQGPDYNNRVASDDLKSSPNKEQGVTDEFEKKKQALETNRQFYNDQDRKDKYLPVLAKKRPRCHKPSLTIQEQKSYLDMKRRFAKLDLSQLNPQQEADYNMFKVLSHKVETEQQKFMKQLRYAFTQCDEDYRYIHSEAEKYINNKMMAKKKRVTGLPRFYYPAKRLQLIDYDSDQKEQPVMLTYLKPLLQLGTVPWMVLPQIVSGLPQPCVPTNCQKVEKVYPNVRNIVKGQCVWNHEVCSQDVNAEQLAVLHRCNFVMSSSVMKHLVDNQGFTSKLWNIPIVVRDYDVKEGDETVTHKVIYLDKPLVKSNQFSVRDKHKLYQKYALRSVAIRENHKPHIFCSTKPSSEVVKYITLEEVYKEMEEFDKKIKDDKPCNQIAFEDSPDESHDEDKEQKKSGRKRRKRVSLDIPDTGPVKKGAGMFDIENEIDDLETFGTDMSWKASNKSDNNTSTKSVLKKGLDPGLESLKHELEGIKSKVERKQIKPSLNANSDTPSAASGMNLNDEKEPDKDQLVTSHKILPSLSEKLKQMSNIRSKLNLKSLHSELEASSSTSRNSKVNSSEIEKYKSKATTEPKEDKNEMKKVDNQADTESDSDQSDEGLVIDMPVSADETALSDTNPAEKSSQSQQNHTQCQSTSKKSASLQCLEICADSEENELSINQLQISTKSSKKDEKGISMETDDTVQNDKEKENKIKAEENVNCDCKDENNSSSTNESDHKDDFAEKNEDVEKSEKEENCAIPENSNELNNKESSNLSKDITIIGVSTRSSKRKSVDKIEDSVAQKRRGLRSGVPTNIGSPHGHFTRQSTKRGSAKEDNEDFKGLEHTDEPQNKISKRASRSRGSSLDTSTDSQSPARRVTRQSVDIADVDSECNKDSNQKKSRPKRKERPSSKKGTQIKMEEEEHDSKKIKEMAKEMDEKVAEKEENPPDLDKDKSEGTSQQEVTKIKFYGTGSPEKDTSTEVEGEKVSESNNQEEIKQEKNFGLDNILNLQTKLLKSPENKEAVRGSFATRHGMSKVVYPLKDNVTYHQWKLGNSNILIRCSYHGVANPQGLIHIATKMEYQPFFGFEKQFSNDVARNWISTYIRPNCTLVRARVNPYNSEIMMMEYIEPKDLIPHDCLFRPNKAMTDLQSILEGLKDIPAGQYLLNNLRQKDHVCLFKATPEGERRCSDIQSLQLGEGSVNVQHKGLTFVRHGLSKQDREGHYGTSIFIPTFKDNKKLDPKRSMYYYLKKTEKFRKKLDGTEELSVFLGLNEPHKPVSSQTISNWIVQTVKMSHTDKVIKIKGHSTRAIGSSYALFKGASLSSIMAAADLSRESTFIKFYLRDMSSQS